jgi:hypothetical protein
MNTNLIAAAIVATCTSGLAYYISTETAVIYVCLIASAYVAVEQLVRTSLTEGNDRRARVRTRIQRKR